jgi:hypothetical protein
MKKLFLTLIVICSVLIVLHIVDFILIMYSDMTYRKMFGPYGTVLSIILLLVMIFLFYKQFRKQK